jgi:hypothetical protein
MVYICYWQNPLFIVGGDKLKVIKDAHFFISDKKEHDILFVQHCFLLHWRWLQEEGIHPKKYIVLSDGCAAQFKACRPMYFVARYPGLTGRCQMKWEYFGIGLRKVSHQCLLHLHVYFKSFSITS